MSMAYPNYFPIWTIPIPWITTLFLIKLKYFFVIYRDIQIFCDIVTEILWLDLLLFPDHWLYLLAKQGIITLQNGKSLL